MATKRKLPPHSSPSAASSSSSSSSSSGEDEQEESPLPPAKNSVSKPTADLSSDVEKEDSSEDQEEEEDDDEGEDDEQGEEDEEGDADQKGLQAIPKAAPREDPPPDSESDSESDSDTEPPKEKTVSAQRRHLAPDPSIKPINSRPMVPKRPFDDGDNEDQPSSRPRKHLHRYDDEDSLLFLRQAFDAITSTHLKDLVTKNQLKLIDKSKAQALEEKFRKIALNKMKYHLKWVDSMKDTMKLIMDALETSE